MVRDSHLIPRHLWLRTVALLALTAAACGTPQAESKPPATAVDPSEQAKIDQGKQLIRQANDALAERKYDHARELLGQASTLGVDSQRFEVGDLLEKVDRRHAKLWAQQVREDLRGADCLQAFKTLDAPLEKLARSDAFTRELSRILGTDALACIEDATRKKLATLEYAATRALLHEVPVRIAIGQGAWEKLNQGIESAIYEAVHAVVKPELVAHRWNGAIEKIKEAEKKSDLTANEVQALIAETREAAAPDLLAQLTKALGQADARSTLEKVDRTITALGFQAVESDGAATLNSENALPPELAGARRTLVIWVDAQRAGIAPLRKAEPRWTYGLVELRLPSAFDGPPRGGLGAGERVWILGTAKNKALVSKEDPGSKALPQALDKAVGWVSVELLSKDDTRDWLLPGDQLVGQRVWGPLRPPDGLLELGIVTAIDGSDVTVKRIADDKPVKVPRTKLRSGRLGEGTKVITFCIAKDQLAQVVEVPKHGRSAKLKCDLGQEKEEDLSSLRTKAELLPPGR